MSKQYIQFKVLDDYGINPTIIKLDVDGYEFRVLKGAKNTLIKKPTIIMELFDRTLKDKGSSAREVVDYLSEFGYSLPPLNVVLSNPS